MNVAPGSPQIIQLNAENFEKQGESGESHRRIPSAAPAVARMPGIHYRRRPDPVAAGAVPPVRKPGRSSRGLKFFQQRGGRNYLGELARQGTAADAIELFSRAASSNPDFGKPISPRPLFVGTERCRSCDTLETAAKLFRYPPTFALQPLSALAQGYAARVSLQKTAENHRIQALGKRLGAPAEGKDVEYGCDACIDFKWSSRFL